MFGRPSIDRLIDSIHSVVTLCVQYAVSEPMEVDRWSWPRINPPIAFVNYIKFAEPFICGLTSQASRYAKLIELCVIFVVVCGITPLLWQRDAGRDARIVGGSEARFGEFPWQVSLRRIVGLISSHRCGAALVHPRWVITAAHCASE